MKIVIALIIFAVIVIFHEFGHFIVAKACSVRVNEFWIGFGPTIFKKQGKETIFSLKLFPLGGACVMEGEDTASDDNKSLTNKKPWQKFLVLFAGSGFNFLLAFIMSVIFVLMVGVDLPVIEGVTPGYAAEAAGLQAGDTIVEMGSYNIHYYQEISIYLFLHDGEDIDVTYKRDGKRYKATLHPMYDEELGRNIIGVLGSGRRTPINFFKALYYGACELKYQLYVTLQSLSMLFNGSVTASDVSGPVGIVSTIGDIYDEVKVDGMFYIIVNMLSLTILLSVNLGVMNLLPIPALDGGRILFVIYEAITKKRVNEDIEGKIHLAGFAILFGIMIFALYNDITRIIK